ncbi:hypothetical protein RvY_17645 [Ramazzottius varieornatus]|uniref:Uncharacterized protein n=1 Tax=Ramazzottius varieornatus TaxID=947166 RepID=A0A1D1W2V2_RAMVA|nr:hypothetical protein RvY_17645 [Ramazzottius varieornatus]
MIPRWVRAATSFINFSAYLKLYVNDIPVLVSIIEIADRTEGALGGAAEAEVDSVDKEEETGRGGEPPTLLTVALEGVVKDWSSLARFLR